MTVPLSELHRLGILPERCIDCDSRRCIDFECRQPKCPPCGASAQRTHAGNIICLPCRQPAGRCLCD